MSTIREQIHEQPELSRSMDAIIAENLEALKELAK